MSTSHARMKLADLTSSIGAGILGVGIGVLAASALLGMQLAIISVGLALHLWGMVDKHRAERGSPQPAWATATYWLCWVGLGVLAVIAIVRAVL